MGDEGRLLVENNFNIKKMGKEFLDMYNKLQKMLNAIVFYRIGNWFYKNKMIFILVHKCALFLDYENK